ncbi:MAG: DNA polymerase/3'-5' exonuclease PolX [Candidatus Dojkabacteria bacterium]|nr:DNA polymerase/3'-5' exonuclease PolX [Candidatus Dojkabacteria bacterium]
MKKPSNKQIATIIAEIADILEMRDEMIFKIRAYQRAAREIEEYPQRIADIDDIKKLQEIPGIGEGIAGKIIEISETGTCEYYEQLKKSIPVDITTLNSLEGLGPKKIKRLYDELGIQTLQDLEKAIREKKIQKLEGFREKTEQNLLKSIESFKKHKGRFRIDEALHYAEAVVENLKKHPTTIRVELAGSLRRRKETIGDADILISSKDPEASMDAFTKLPEIARVLGKGKTKATIEFANGFQADLRIIDDKTFGAALQYFTGDKSHNIKVRKIAIDKKFKLNEYGLFNKSKKFIAGKTEEEIYTKLGMQIPPAEIRRDTGEIEAALNNKLPKLIDVNDIKGDLQMHTTMSDGLNSAEEMAKMGAKLGYEYIAITEHNTEGLEVAGGVSSREIPEYINKLKSSKADKLKCQILAGLEINIAKDGKLTVPDKYLKMLDFVLVAVHSHFRMSKNEMTKRILTTFENPYVHAFAHPTGRLLLRRDPYEFDFEAICKKAKEKNILLELNAHPERLDLDGESAKMAKEIGCKFTLGTDSHSTTQMENMKYGVYMARRGWLEKKDVINTLDYQDLKNYLAKRYLR